MIELEYAVEIVAEQSEKGWNAMIDYLKSSGQSHLIHKMGKMPSIIWKKFGYRMAGRYCWCKRMFEDGFDDYIEMNINFLTVKDVNTFLRDTILHELAHCINKRVCNGNNHDKTWNFIAKKIGDSGEIYHSYGLAKSYSTELKIQHKIEMTNELNELYNELDDADFE